MNLDPRRLKRQREAAQSWGLAGGKGTVEAATGFGKTRAAIEALKALRLKYPSKAPWEYPVDTIVVVPTKNLKESWEADFKAEGIDDVEVWVINSLVTRSHKCRLLILDEIHMYTGDVFSLVFKRVDYKYVLGLTATLPPDDERRRTITQYAPVVDTIPLEECLENGWVSPFSVFNLGLTLSPEEEEEYRKMNRAFGKHFGYFSHDLSKMFACLRDKREREHYARSLNMTPDEVFYSAVNAKRNMDNRKKFLWEYPGKIDSAVEIVNTFPEARVVTFCQTTEVADILCDELGNQAVAYHSNIKGRNIHGKYFGKNRILQYNLERFKAEDINVRVLNTAKALDQGADLPSVDFLILLSSSSKAIQGLQRYGRGIRFVEGKHTIIVEIYVKGTQDEKWLRSRQKEIPKSAIQWVSSVDEIQHPQLIRQAA